MPTIVHTAQAGFIKDRIISDNIILASELLGTFNYNSKETYFCAKFDIHKAFDTVSRHFLLDRLRAKGFPSIFISWIQACISDIHFSVAINGALECYFNSTSGLRQGFPLSPYLFTIVMDGLSACFEEANTNQLFSGISLGNSLVTHLLYADDLLVFSKATLREASSLKTILENFESHSGLRVNPSKSSIIFSKNCITADDICLLLNIQQTLSPIKYLGIPVFTKKLSQAHFQPLLLRITKALDGCKAKTLSFGGRIQFLRYTIMNTIAFWVRGSSIPKSCFKTLNKLCSRFLFYKEISVKKLHLIAWKDTCTPTINGGIGLPSLDSLSFGFSCSTIWRFLNGSNPLFQWWRNRYKSLWAPLPNRRSHFWFNLCKVAQLIKHCISLRVYPSCNFSLIWDPWCFGNSLISIFQDLDLAGYDNLNSLTVSDIVSNGTWAVPDHWPLLLANKINSVYLASSFTGCLWNNGEKVSNKFFQNEYFKQLQKVTWHSFIWHKHSAIRYSSYGWLAVRQGLKTSDQLLKRGISVNTSCVFCQYFCENHSHLFFECDFSFMVLNSLIPQSQTLLLRPNLLQAFEFIEDISDNRIMRNCYCLMLNAAVYFIWRARNDRLFGNIIECYTTVARKVKKACYAKIMDWKNAHGILHLLG
ncbi:Putative ribonuclease H protein [Dendrobium catenatum]|uniref:Ribonuclease H protein n=1 Tax=Dendrobium catenatum TaxID=906689 RepID=A0A2I0X2I1_9ASPA|nr:Putative ribonuclease H protein [Dendrobium catenatum]